MGGGGGGVFDLITFQLSFVFHIIHVIFTHVTPFVSDVFALFFLNLESYSYLRDSLFENMLVRLWRQEHLSVTLCLPPISIVRVLFNTD